MTLTQFCNSSNLPSSLVRAVVRQMGGWEAFQESAEDVCNHGIDSGFHGFIYYSDTVKFAKANKSDILAACNDMASDIGSDGLISFLTGFNCLRDYSQDEITDGIYNPRSDNHTAVFNALAWFAAEEVCRSYVDQEVTV